MPVRQPPGLRHMLALCVVAIVGGCVETEEVVPADARPVRVITVQERIGGEAVSLAGTVESQVQVDLGFRIGGRVVERLVNVGDVVSPGQVLARLDPADEENGLRAAEANLAAAEAQLVEAEANLGRQRQLYDRGFLARAGLDRAEASQATALSATDAARAQYGVARRRLNDTVLYADAPGTVTAQGAEPGEVVTPGRMIVQVARDEGKDAVFDVPEAMLGRGGIDNVIKVSLSQNPSITAEGRVREVSPRADAATGTFRVRVGLIDPPPELRLGSTITGQTTFDPVASIEIPASALTSADGQSAVWVVDPATQTVALRAVEVADFTPSSVQVTGGVQEGDIVVTAGVQALRPGQKVRLLGLGS